MEIKTTIILLDGSAITFTCNDWEVFTRRTLDKIDRLGGGQVVKIFASSGRYLEEHTVDAIRTQAARMDEAEAS